MRVNWKMDRVNDPERKVNIVGAGLAGLAAALTLSRAGIPSRLISVQTSERAQSNLAEGGINACLNVMGEDDHPLEHYEDTMKGGCDLADPNMAAGLCLAAPGIIGELIELGVPFQRENGQLVQRSFGGQKKKRTSYVKSSTGKMITASMIDAVRRYECEGLVERFPRHEFRQLMILGGSCAGVLVHDNFRGEDLCLMGSVILAMGGMNGMFSGQTTGSTANTGNAAAVLFAQGVKMANLEMIQYHPTTVKIAGKRMLISEAARGEGGRLFYYGDDSDLPAGERSKVRFMEDKYGERGNLMPRDVVSREMAACGKEVYLDLTGLPDAVWEKKLSDLREEIIHYLAIDPRSEPVPVAPGIHFFMGGILIDEGHRSSIPGLYAAGECACGYHGANRLGGNSLLAAIYGGKTAAHTAAADRNSEMDDKPAGKEGNGLGDQRRVRYPDEIGDRSSAICDEQVSQILLKSLPILRNEKDLSEGLMEIRNLKKQMKGESSECVNSLSYCRILLAEAILMSAAARKESRGAHYVREYPERAESFRKTTVVRCERDSVVTEFREIPVLRDSLRSRLYDVGNFRSQE